MTGEITFKEKRRIVRTFQDDSCATGEVKLVDDKGSVWKESDSSEPITGVTKGKSDGQTIWVNK